MGSTLYLDIRREMLLYIKTSTEEILTLYVNPNDSIEYVKDMI